MRKNRVEICVLYDNETLSDDLESGWGLSVWIETPWERFVFDAASTYSGLLNNLKRLEKDPAEVDSLFLSHFHWDHIMGHELFSRSVSNIYVTEGFSPRFLEKFANRVTSVGSHPLQISQGVYSSGAMGDELEHAMILDTAQGALLICGCCHPGAVDMAKIACKITGKRLYGVIGGLHLYDLDEAIVTKTLSELKALGAKLVAPLHCSGEGSYAIGRKLFGEGCIKAGAGSRLEFKLE